MKPPVDDTRRHLGELASLSKQTEDMERKILERAENRLAAVGAELKGMRGKLQDAASQERYQELTLEVGQLQQVIAQANETLGVDA